MDIKKALEKIDEMNEGWWDSEDGPDYDDDFNPKRFRQSGSALHPGTEDDPIDQPCPTCGEEDVLTRRDVAKGYQCDTCADRAEGKIQYESKTPSLKDYFQKISEDSTSGMKPLPVLDPKNQQVGAAVIKSKNPAIQKMLQNLTPQDVQVVQTMMKTGSTTQSGTPTSGTSTGSMQPMKEASGAPTINGKEVDISSLEIGDVDTGDYPDFADAFISKGTFADGTPMSDEDLEEFQDQYSDIVHKLAHDSLYEGKPKNKYAIGMAAAMKQTGDKPPLKKSTIVKAHEITKAIKEEQIDEISKAKLIKHIKAADARAMELGRQGMEKYKAGDKEGGAEALGKSGKYYKMSSPHAGLAHKKLAGVGVKVPATGEEPGEVKYVITKVGRTPGKVSGLAGQTVKGITIKDVYTDKAEAQKHADHLSQFNPVGYEVVRIFDEGVEDQKLGALAREIEMQVGAHFPDSEGLDAIMSRARKIYGFDRNYPEHMLMDLIDAAAKKHLGSNDFYSYVEDFHAQHASDNPEDEDMYEGVELNELSIDLLNRAAAAASDKEDRLRKARFQNNADYKLAARQGKEVDYDQAAMRDLDLHAQRLRALDQSYKFKDAADLKSGNAGKDHNLDYVQNRAKALKPGTLGKFKAGEYHKKAKELNANQPWYNRPTWFPNKDQNVAEGKLNEKWGTETKVAPSEKGKYKGKTKAELLKHYNKLKKSGPHKKGSKEYGTMRELSFAIRAKSGWGKVKEAERPSDQVDMGAGLGAGRSQTVLESNMKKTCQAAYHEGKSHGLGGHAYTCRYDEGTDEHMHYHKGFKEGLDECYGIDPMRGVVDEEMRQTVPGMANQAMDECGMMEDDMDEGLAGAALGGAAGAYLTKSVAGASTGAQIGSAIQDKFTDLEEMNKTDYMKHMAKKTPGDTFKAFGQTFHDDEVLESDYTFESLDKQLNALLNESEQVTEGSAAKKVIIKGLKNWIKAAKEQGYSVEGPFNPGGLYQAYSQSGSHRGTFSSEDEPGPGSLWGNSKPGMSANSGTLFVKNLSESEHVTEGISVSISKGQQGGHDSVSVTATDHEADNLLALVKNAGMGIFADEHKASDYGAPVSHEGHAEVEDHGSVLDLMKKMAGIESKSDYEQESDEGCGCGQSPCGCDQLDEVESEDQMEFEVAEDATEVAMTNADEEDEAQEDEALAQSDELNEWANDAMQKGTEEAFTTGDEFMLDTISSGLNKKKPTGQATIPVNAAQKDRLGYNESILDWKKLAGI